MAMVLNSFELNSSGIMWVTSGSHGVFDEQRLWPTLNCSLQKELVNHRNFGRGRNIIV